MREGDALCTRHVTFCTRWPFLTAEAGKLISVLFCNFKQVNRHGDREADCLFL